jgi:quercetin dioxygenase-like cupin family protein
VETTTASADTAVGTNDVQRLLAEGRLRLDQLLDAELHEGQVLNWVRVELAPGTVEPDHVHPGLEGIFVVAGRGFVRLDEDRVTLAPGAFVRVEQGTVKALGNDGSEPLVVLAVLVLEGDQPPLTVAQM